MLSLTFPDVIKWNLHLGIRQTTDNWRYPLGIEQIIGKSFKISNASSDEFNT